MADLSHGELSRCETAAVRAWRSRGAASAPGLLLLLPLLAACGPRAAQQEQAQREPAAAPPPAVSVSGEQVYAEHCATCHMADGNGVPNMQPGLVGSPIVTGDPGRLYAVIRAGSAALRDRESEFGNEMPPFGMLSEDEVTAVAEYVRRQFGGNES